MSPSSRVFGLALGVVVSLGTVASLATAGDLVAPHPSTPAVPIAAAQEPPAKEGKEKSIAIQAKRFEFAPSTLTLTHDEPVELALSSEDVRHGFFSRELGIDSEFVPGKTTVARLTPHKPGTYTVICDRFCGAGHGNMKLTVVVE
jgi:cytochrome c oxidase subunit 2